MKFPLPRNLFPPLELTSDQEEQYERLANSLIRETLAEYDAFVVDQSRRVNTARWKQVKRRDEVTIYRERSAGGAMRSLSTPAMSFRSANSDCPSSDSFSPSLASSAGAKSTSYSLAQTIRMPPSSTSNARGRPSDLDPLSSPDSFGGERHSLDTGIFGRTIGFPSSGASSVSAMSDEHFSTSSSTSRYSMISRSSSSGSGKLPRLLAVGTLRGSLDDVMYGIVTPNASTVRLRTSYLDDDIADCAVLTELIAPTTNEPFRFLGIKWLVKENRRTAAFVWPRDFIVLEHSGVMLRPDGARIGFHLMHSVNIPACRELTERHILRAKLSSCYIYEEKHNGRVDVYMTAQVEPRGLVMERLALRSAARALSSCWKSVTCAQNKKLAYYLQNERHSQLPTPARAAVPTAMPVLEAAHNGKNCGICHQRFGVLNRVITCQLCCEQICYRCRMVRKLSSQLIDTMVTKTPIVFCKKCVMSINDESALEIASKEMWDTRGGANGRARSSSASSYLTGRGSQPSVRSRRSRADSFSSERDTYSSVVLGQHTSSDLESRRSAVSTASSTRSDQQPLPPSFARQSSLGSHSRGSAARVKRVSYSLTGPLSQNTGSTETLSIADLDGSDGGDDRDSVAMARGDEPVMLDDSLTKIQHVDFVDMPSNHDDDSDDTAAATPTKDSPRQTQPALVRLYDAESGSPPRVYARSTVIKDAADVDFEFRMSELAHVAKSPPRVEVIDATDKSSLNDDSLDGSHDGHVVAAEVVEAADAIEIGSPLSTPATADVVSLSSTMLDTESAPPVHTSSEADTAPRFRAHTTATTTATAAPGPPSGSYQSQLWRQMSELHSVVESTYQVAKANTELAKATTAAAERPRNFRTYSQFNFNVVGLRPTRAMTTVANTPSS